VSATQQKNSADERQNCAYVTLGQIAHPLQYFCILTQILESLAVWPTICTTVFQTHLKL